MIDLYNIVDVEFENFFIRSPYNCRTLINETPKSPPYKSFYNKYILKIKIFILVISVDYLFK